MTFFSEYSFPFNDPKLKKIDFLWRFVPLCTNLGWGTCIGKTLLPLDISQHVFLTPEIQYVVIVSGGIIIQEVAFQVFISSFAANLKNLNVISSLKKKRTILFLFKTINIKKCLWWLTLCLNLRALEALKPLRENGQESNGGAFQAFLGCLRAKKF